MTELFVVITVIVVALIFDFTNGFHDSANAMAGPIATGALRPRVAVILAAVLNLVGACLSTAVAKTISGGLFDDSLITAPIVLAGLLGAIIWNLADMAGRTALELIARTVRWTDRGSHRWCRAQLSATAR